MSVRAISTLVAALGLTACAPEPTPILASEGGVVTSEDGVLTLVLPPGALPRDTPVSIRVLPEAEWPLSAPGRFMRIGEVYRVEPGGLELAEDAYAIVRPPDPSVLRGAEDDLVPSFYLYSPREDKVSPAPATRTLHLADGRIAIVGTLYELGDHWVGDRVPGAERMVLPALHVELAASAGERTTWTSWSVETLAIRADATHALFGREAWTAVVHGAASGLVPEGSGITATRTWDAPGARAFGLHPYEVFGIGAGAARSEHRLTASDLEPVTLEPGAPLSPLVDPLPGFRCDAASEEVDTWAGVDVVTGASSGVVTVGVAHQLGPATCR